MNDTNSKIKNNDKTYSLPTRFIQIDEEGYFLQDGVRASDEIICRNWLAQVELDPGLHPVTVIDGQSVLIECFDEPYIALSVEKHPNNWMILLPYGHTEYFELENLTLDEWDRFHGMTSRGVPFVFSRQAQNQFFNLLDEFDDDSITSNGKQIAIRPWLQDNSDGNIDSFWTNIYRTEEPRWELNGPVHILPKIIPKLKLQRCRVLVAGSGTGNDAAWFAEHGHIVTAIDFSEEAIVRAQKKYGHLPDLKFLRSDVFNLPQEMSGSFDLVFEHTLYCAIAPSRRNDLVKVWRRVLSEQGHLMGVFFTFEKTSGPPYGGSEWEIRQRLSKSFRPLYWNRLRDSRPNRLGQELFVYAQKRTEF